MSQLNEDVTKKLNELNHPLIKEINLLRNLIIDTNSELIENYKWNAPNFCYKDTDCITFRINPQTAIQIVFHRGAKKLAQPNQRPIMNQYSFLEWKENDRCVATFKLMEEIKENIESLKEVITKWIQFVQDSL